MLQSKRVTRLAQGRPTVKPGGRLASLLPLIPSLSSTCRLKKTAKEIIILHFCFNFTAIHHTSAKKRKKKRNVKVWFLKNMHFASFFATVASVAATGITAWPCCRHAHLLASCRLLGAQWAWLKHEKRAVLTSWKKQSSEPTIVYISPIFSMYKTVCHKRRIRETRFPGKIHVSSSFIYN